MQRGPFAMAVALALILVPCVRGEAQCRGADSTATHMISKYSGLMRRAATDGVLRVKVQGMGLALVDPATVVLVTDRNTCAKAERAYSAALKGNGVTPSGSVYVVKVGSGYVVRDPAQSGSGWYAEMVLDGSFRITYRMMA